MERKEVVSIRGRDLPSLFPPRSWAELAPKKDPSRWRGVKFVEATGKCRRFRMRFEMAASCSRYGEGRYVPTGAPLSLVGA